MFRLSWRLAVNYLAGIGRDWCAVARLIAAFAGLLVQVRRSDRVTISAAQLVDLPQDVKLLWLRFEISLPLRDQAGETMRRAELDDVHRSKTMVQFARSLPPR